MTDYGILWFYERLWKHYDSAVYMDPCYEHYDTGQPILILLKKTWYLIPDYSTNSSADVPQLQNSE